MSLLEALHQFAELISTYAGLFGITVQIAIGYVIRQLKSIFKKRKNKTRRPNQ